MFPIKSLIAFAAAVSAFSSAEVLAHATFVPKDNYVTPDGRSYLEGKNSELNLNLAHACSPDTGTVIATTVFPNGDDNEVYDLELERQPDGSLKVTQDPIPSTWRLSDAIDGDALSSIKPRIDGDWQEISLKKDEKGKLRGTHWHGGWVPDAYYERVAFRATFAKFQPESCVTKVRVYLPAIQYCGKLTSQGNAPVIGTDYPPFVARNYWLWRAVPEAGIESIDTGSDGKPVTIDLGRAPYIDIDRDLENNNLPNGCKSHDVMVCIRAWIPLRVF